MPRDLEYCGGCGLFTRVQDEDDGRDGGRGGRGGGPVGLGRWGRRKRRCCGTCGEEYGVGEKVGRERLEAGQEGGGEVGMGEEERGLVRNGVGAGEREKNWWPRFYGEEGRGGEEEG